MGPVLWCVFVFYYQWFEDMVRNKYLDVIHDDLFDFGRIRSSEPSVNGQHRTAKHVLAKTKTASAATFWYLPFPGREKSTIAHTITQKPTCFQFDPRLRWPQAEKTHVR